MRALLTRAAVVAVAVVAVLPTIASAAVDEYVADASTSAVHLSVFEDQVGSPLLDLVSTSAFGNSDPMATAGVDAITVLGTTIGEIRSAESDRERVRDPESGDGCVVPVSTSGISVDAICALARARAGNPGDTGNQDAAGITELADVEVDGSLLAAALSAPLDTFLSDLIATQDLDGGALDAAIDAFTAECNTILAGLTGSTPDDVEELIDTMPTDDTAINDLINDVGSGSTNACTAIIMLSTNDLTQDVIDVAPLAAALDGVPVIQLTIDGAKSEVAGTDTTIGAAAEQVFVSVDGPSLSFLDDALNAVVEGIYAGFVQEMEDLTGEDAPDDLDFSDEIAGALAEVPLFGISDPLLTATVSGGTADAELALEDASAVAGGDEPFVTVTIAPGVVELLGGDPAMASLTLESGESQTIGEGTPIESSISVGAVAIDEDAEDADTGLRGIRATASATQVHLLSGVEGGVELTLARSTAGVFGTTVVAAGAPPPDENLPRTGGGAALLAALALGGALVLWRRNR